MIDSIDTDRIELESNIKSALAILINQELVEKTTHGYEFLTDAEQDISKQIKKQNVDASEISNTIGNQLFVNSKISRKFTYPKLNNQYNFGFNAYVDSYPIGAVNNEMSIKVNTPESDYHRDEVELTRLSIDPTQPPIIIDMPEEDSYLDDIRQSIKIKKFAYDVNNQPSDERSRQIIEIKKLERTTLDRNATKELMEALQDADIYISGRKLESSGKDFFKRLAEAEIDLIDEVYRSLNYIEVTKSDKDITALFKDNDLNVKTDENSQATQALLDSIGRGFDGRNKISYKSILDKFSKIPYGYKEIDIRWLAAKLFVDAKLKLYVNNISVSFGIDSDPLAMSQYFTKKSFTDKVQFEPRREISMAKKKDLLEVADEVFNKRSFSNDEDDTGMNELKMKISMDLKNLRENQAVPSYYPGIDLIDKGVNMLQKLYQINDTDNFYDQVSKSKDDLLDWHDDMDDFGIIEFYNSKSQKEIWENAHRKLDIYKNSETFITDEELPKLVKSIREILNSNRPQGQVNKLKDYNSEFVTEYSKAFDSNLTDVKGDIKVGETSVIDYARENDCLDDLESRITTEFKQLTKEAEDSVNLDKLMIISKKVTVLGTRLKDQVDRIVQSKISPIDPPVGPNPVPNPPKITPAKIKHISINSLQISKSWRINNEQDIDKELDSLRNVLIEQLKNNDSINVDL